ncbi:metallophosphoesterase [Empedobacter falsenii]|uniref:Metallophosphoesterase n=1 Tax=Empedobacter falsenii TaxID=343874 RepID=A0ABY8V927_9FLAO|nr:metallophosphoesterase [Empedobacter falsenii]WIH97406.1 metallophosphoesterase [Empedobacter falsenii]
MIRILHLTDFHLNNRTLEDWNKFFKAAFFNKIDDLQSERKIDLVLFTGDMIDKAGKDFGSVKEGLDIFNEQIIQPILEKLELDISRFILCPGNHDINRSKDDEIDENGVKSTLTNTEKVIDFIINADKNNSYKRIERIKEYKEFEKELYKNVTDKDQSIFKFSLKIEIDGKTIGISSLNSSWRCFGDNDFQNIILGENQINNNYLFIKDCHIKIALIHHQLDWFKDFEKSTISSHINKKYDLVLSGHVHENMSNMSTGFTGNCFYNVSPSGLNQIRTDSKNFSNGFTVIDYNDSINCHYLKYNHNQESFVDNTDIVPNGKKIFAKPPVESDDIIGKINQAISNIKDDHTSEMDEHFIKGKNELDKVSVKSAFVFPPIDDGGNLYEVETTETSLNEIMNSNDNYLFLGTQEIGKKSLLYRIVTEYIDEYEIYKKIPVFIDFTEIKNKDFETVIKEYTRLSSNDVKDLLKEGKIILLIDNLSFLESKNLGTQINKLHRFIKDYSSNRIIGTYEHDGIEILPKEIISNSKIPFSYRYIRGLKTKEVKQIMKQWLPEGNELESEEKLEKLVKTFSSYHLPNNALSVHLYLWSVENSDRTPINQAVLMEIYTELILEKLSKENIYRSNFDFKNKIQLISMVAEKIIRKEDNNYKLSYKEFVEIIDDYLTKKVGFSFDVEIIVKYLIERKIFIKNTSNEIKFSHICFMHFFTAKRMADNTNFKKFILDESRYFNYPKEIDYYTGLVRSDEETFEIIYSRFKELFNPMDFILEKVNPDEYFDFKLEQSNSKNTSEPIARNVEIAKIKDNRPSDQLVEQKYDEQLNRISKRTTEIKNNTNIDFDRMLLIMCNTLRNSEGIENLELKKQAYNDIVKHNITYSIFYTQLLIRYILEHQKLPPSVPQNISLDVLLKNIPFHIQHSLHEHLGTKKLSNVILSKMSEDFSKGNKKNEIEKYLSVTLYSDVYGDNFENYLKKFIKSVDCRLVQDYLLLKLTDYLYKRSKPDTTNEEMYLDLISDLQIRSQKLPKRLKDSIIKDIKDKKNKMTKYIGLN